ncbi:hypothetical protein GCM10025868_08480 [Angustibacter aerolatus]|uniref:Magnesium chelatase ChlI-like catalytic domain-containing protein n=1 Tax=Angustibacter aerolatus TaxID=1162965 RepID=A0ABQ6JBP7_9ACTN|nr:hypothetical protein GCM10025868_08480 [Angustibacter aerolatus]
MALGRTLGVALAGIDGHVVDVEADVASGLPAFTVTGLPDAALGEARDRVRAACANSQVPIPMQRLTVNLSPASLPKAGTGFDLAIAVAVLVAAEQVPQAAVDGVVHLGEPGARRAAAAGARGAAGGRRRGPGRGAAGRGAHRERPRGGARARCAGAAREQPGGARRVVPR